MIIVKMSQEFGQEFYDEYAHWKYQFDRLDSFNVDDLRKSISTVATYVAIEQGERNSFLQNSFFRELKDMEKTILWLREEARFKVIHFEIELDNITDD